MKVNVRKAAWKSQGIGLSSHRIYEIVSYISTDNRHITV
jgi:hypothetical protein